MDPNIYRMVRKHDNYISVESSMSWRCKYTEEYARGNTARVS